MINASSLDEIRIDVLGECRAVRMSGGKWVECVDKLRAIVAESEAALGQLDELAQVWGDEGVFRRCRDRLRKAIEDAKVWQ